MYDQPRGLVVRTSDYEVPGSIPGSTMGIFPCGGRIPVVTMVWVVSRIRLKVEGAITQSIVIESTTEISSLEGTSPRQTASTSARRVPNTLIADYGREREKRTLYNFKECSV